MENELADNQKPQPASRLLQELDQVHVQSVVYQLVINGHCFRCILRILKSADYELYRDRSKLIAYILDICSKYHFKEPSLSQCLTQADINVNYIQYKHFCHQPSNLEKVDQEPLQKEQKPQKSKEKLFSANDDLLPEPVYQHHQAYLNHEQNRSISQKNYLLGTGKNQQILENSIHQWVPLEQSCPTCLGILQICDREEYLDKIRFAVQESQYQYKSFKFNVKIPLACLLRHQHSCQLVARNLKYDKQVMQVVLENSSDILEIKIVIKWIMAPLLAALLNCPSNLNEDFIINLNFDNTLDEKQLFKPFRASIQSHLDKQFHKKKQLKGEHSLPPVAFTQHNLKTILNDREGMLEKLGVSAPVALTYKTLYDFSLESGNIYVKGNYLKYSRTLSQTPWTVDGQKLYATSLQDEIAKELSYMFQPEDIKFHSGGREDIDVRMLGKGRPFMIQFVNPKKRFGITEEMIQEAQKRINSSELIGVRNLCFADVGNFDVLKESESEKIKAYVCLVGTKAAVTQEMVNELEKMEDIQINQITPLRVVHRRTLMNREKVIHRIRVKAINQYMQVVFVLASAGTYIKEFIHSDLGRTLPNYGSLLATQADIFQLDVLDLYEKLDASNLNQFEELVNTSLSQVLH